TAAELKRVQEFLAGSFALSLESPTNRMFRLALSELYLGGFEAPEEVLARMRAVTAAGGQALAQRLLAPERLALGVVVPQNGIDVTRLRTLLVELLAAAI